MSLDVRLMVVMPTEVYSANITHNLGDMAKAAGLYEALWRPEELGITKAKELVPYITQGLDLLRAMPKYFETFNPANGWGNYNTLVDFVDKYLEQCLLNPEATVEVSR